MNFNYARDLVAAATDVHNVYQNGYSISDYGWEDENSFLVVVDDPQIWDAPTILVNKATSEVSVTYGLNAAGDPTAGMAPIGTIPV